MAFEQLMAEAISKKDKDKDKEKKKKDRKSKYEPFKHHDEATS